MSLTACTLWQCKNNAFWPQSHIQTRMHHHNFPRGLLCVRQLWGSQSQDEVSINFQCLDSLWDDHNDRWLFTNIWSYYLFREFAKTIKRPFTVRYNPYTHSVDVLKDTPSINSVVEELRHELDIVGDALIRLNEQQGVWLPTFQWKLQTYSPSTLVFHPEIEIPPVYGPSSVQWMCTAYG